MSLAALLATFLAAPSAGFALSAGYAPQLLPLLLFLYWGLLPPVLYGVGALPIPLRFPQVRGEIYALVLPYLAYWPVSRWRGTPLGGAYRAFMRGPGLGVPLAAFAGGFLGLHLPPLATSLAVFSLALFLERALRKALNSTPRP